MLESFLDKDFVSDQTREKQLVKHFSIKKLEPICQDEYVKIPVDLPWKELEKDVPSAFDKFGWYGMCHRGNSEWNRSKLYGGLGLNYNPDHRFQLPTHAHGLGQPRSIKNVNAKEWVNDLENYDYSNQTDEIQIKGFNTYDDCLGLRVATDVTNYRSFSTIFDKLKRKSIQGRIAEIKAAEHGKNVSENDKEFMWHTDERNEIVSRVLIPIVFDEDYFIEFKNTGTKLYFEPGYAYHWNTYNVHRFNFNYHDKIKNRTCIVLGWSPWLDFDGESWVKNEYCNKIHPTDMVKQGLVI
tara:strand:+ start:912 stop:1799 length:888 start_codon:yes stop_codon:yes gene_type:complete